ncbi:MAG: glycerol-3-phosphate dehydrogenase [Candidatus Rokuibacteriota bacterium]|nr:MAG: glycerol-3-phosphate dehydrogenase [Candidatus Rokubacteria bacterium]
MSGAAVVGAGSWGTALAAHLARLGTPTRLWARDAAVARSMAAARENPRYLPGVRLPDLVEITGDRDKALAGADLVVVAVPSHFLRGVLTPMAPFVPPGAILLSATKGLEPASALRMSEVLSQIAPGRTVAVLSGPSFAREVVLGRPTALVVASSDVAAADELQGRLTAPGLRLYTNRDVIGVEIGGALKNVMAIATGLSDGLELGENARAALITRGLAMIAEGVRTVASALTLARTKGVSMPICEQVSAVLFDGRAVRDALQALLAREPRPEEEGAVRG